MEQEGTFNVAVETFLSEYSVAALYRTVLTYSGFVTIFCIDFILNTV